MIAALLTLPPLLIYAALFGLIAGESSGLPLPGETGLIAAGALAHHAGVSIVAVVGTAAAAAIVGDNVGFLLGRSGGRWLLGRDGRWATARRRYLQRGERFFERHGPRAVFFARWLPGLRVVGAWLAGAHGMRWRSFLLWNAVGGLAWAASIGALAYAFGQAVERALRNVGIVGACALVAALVAAAVVVRIRHRRAERGHYSARSEHGHDP